MTPEGKPRRGRKDSVPDAAGSSGDGPSMGGGFFRLPEELEEVYTTIREEGGADAEQAARRTMASALNPRLLTDTARGHLQASLAPVLLDVAATGAIMPQIREESHEDLGEDMVSALIQGPDGIRGMGIRINMSLSPGERLADIAEQLQEWEVEELAAAGRSASWPECPEHPNSHPLSPQVLDGTAMWCCPRNGHVEYPIGGVPASR